MLWPKPGLFRWKYCRIIYPFATMDQKIIFKSLEKQGNKEIGPVLSIDVVLDFVLDNNIIFAICQCEGVCRLVAKLFMHARTMDR